MAITYNDLFLDVRRELKRGGVIDTTLEARELTCFGTGKTREELTRDGRLYAPPELERRVRELRDEGVLTEERPGIFNLKTVVRQYVAYKTGGTKDDQSRLAAARADREETRGKIEKMKMEEAKGSLHRTEDIENGLKTAFANFKDRLEAIPTKYADTMAQLTDPADASDILRKAIQEALVELSDPDIALQAPEGEAAEDEQEE